MVALSVAVSAKLALMETDVGVRLHVGVLTGFETLVVTAQVSVTVPLNEFAGVTVMVEVLPVVAPAIKLRVVGLLLTANVGAAVTVTFTVVFCEMAPEVPVTVTT